MHINAKRMKRRIDKAQKISYVTNCLDFEEPEELADTIIEPTIKPEYLAVTGYKERAELMGLTISTEPDTDGGTRYTIAGGVLDALDEPAETYHTAEELQAGVNSLWDTVTEPEIDCYIDADGITHERLTYPESPLY